ncbi:unnamed protein product [Adineta ricciae]|uniref:Uncharacterized protein n=1 Tax=Adineta ricciae TaxID=249248 RepID=A0A815JZI4_ADIRI|nr:unnamed protein product [Adineta ricciae]CAF1385833.1 unnamed protein product [Adineta ricciae]
MTTEQQLDRAIEHARNGQYDEAADEFTAFIEKNRTDSDGYFYRGCIYLHLNKYEQAIHDFTSTICLENCLHARRLLALYKRAFAKFKLNQFESAMDDYKFYVGLCKNHTQLYVYKHKGLFQIGVIYAILSQYDEAIFHFTEAIRSSSGSAEDEQKWYHLHRGRAYACVEKYSQAQKDLQIVCEHTQDHFLKGCAYSELGRHHDALVEFDNLLKPNANKCELILISTDQIRFRRGLCYASLDQHDKALTDFKDALTDRTQHTSSAIKDRILFRRALSFMALNKMEKALINLNRSIQMNDNQPDVFYARAMMQYQVGRHNTAVEDHRIAVELKQMSHTHKSNSRKKLNIYFTNKIQETENFLALNHDMMTKANIIRIITEYLQKQAYYSRDPLKMYENARERLYAISQLQNVWQDEDTIALAVNSLTICSYVADRYSNDHYTSKFMAEKYIQHATDSILKTCDIFDKYITRQDLKQLRGIMYDERVKSNTLHECLVNEVRNTYVEYQLKKCDIVEENMNIFVESPAQQKFSRYFASQLCNLFDGIGMIDTDVCSSLSSQDNQSMALKLVAKLSGLSAIDLRDNKKGIENTLCYLASFGNPEMYCELAYKIVNEITMIYEEQINRLVIDMEELDMMSISTQPDIVDLSDGIPCIKGCSRSTRPRPEDVLNDAQYSTIQTVVRYAMKQILRCLTEVNVKWIFTMKDVHDLLIDTVCRPSFLTPVQIPLQAEIVILKNRAEKIEYWSTYEFYRRPAIKFDDGETRARRENDEEKFGCRKANLQEKDLYANDRLDSYGFMRFSPKNVL